MAGTLQPEPGNAVAHAQVLHPAGVRAQVRPHPVQRPLDPFVHVQRVQPVQQQQALHQRVGDEPVHNGPARRALLGQGGHDGRQAVPVHADQQADQLLSGVGGGAAACPQGGQEFLDPLARPGNAGHRASLPWRPRHRADGAADPQGVRLPG